MEVKTNATENGLMIFQNEELEQIKENFSVKDYFGVFYALEFGNNVKIGSTSNIVQRIKQLRQTANYAKVKIGRIAVSQYHTNYADNEKYLHEILKEYRLPSTELFDICFDTVIDFILGDTGIVYLDESIKKESRSNSFFNAMKNYTLTGSFSGNKPIDLKNPLSALTHIALDELLNSMNETEKSNPSLVFLYTQVLYAIIGQKEICTNCKYTDVIMCIEEENPDFISQTYHHFERAFRFSLDAIIGAAVRMEEIELGYC